MYKPWLKICSIILVAALCINMLPMTVFAQEFRENISATEQAAPIEAEEAYIVSEITEKRTEFSKEFQLSNGLRMAAVYADAVHYETENGWEDIDNTLVAKADGTYANTAGVWDVRFPSQLTKTQGVTIEKDGYTLSFYMAGELNSNHELMSATEPVTVESQAVLTETVPETTTPPLTEPTAETIEIIPETTAETVSETVAETVPSETVTETVALETLPTITEVPETTAPVQATAPILEQLPEVSTETLTLAEVSLSTATVHEMDTAALKAAFAYEEMAPEKNHSRLSYSNVFPNTQVIYDLDANKVKESIVLDSYKSSLRGYRYTLHTGEMLPVLEESGQILFYDKAQENIVMVMPAPYLVDDAGEYNSDIRVSLTGGSGTYTLTYTLPAQWLAAQDRAWPVILDPCVAPALTTSNIHDQTVSQKRSLDRTWGILDAGYSTADGITRFFLQYKNLPTITSSDVIVDAAIQLRKAQTSTTSAPVEVHKVNSTWEASTITWSNKPAFNTNIEDYAIVKDSGHYSWSITDLVREWYTGQNTGMMFKVSDAVENGGTQNYKQFYSSDYTENDEYQPVLIIKFRNNNGVEGYWDYTTSSAGRAGTGYVNNYTGNLVWTRIDMGFEGNRMPVSITAVYNANDAVRPSDNNNSNDTAGNSLGMGNGWRTNYNQLVYHWQVDGQSGDYYVWEDEDGTDHYFKYDSANTYKDEDNLELTLTTNGSGDSKYTITTKYGETRHFDTNGRLTKISNNQKVQSHIIITYNSATSRLIDTVKDGAGRVYDFVYDNDFLSQLRFPGDEDAVVTYNYTDSCLTRVTYADGEAVNYTYNSDKMLLTAQDIDGYKLTYTYHPRSGGTWQPYRVASVAESHQKESSTAAGGSLSFVYAHNQTTVTDHRNNVNILQFNDMGNTVSIQDDEGHAQYAKFAKNSADDTGKGNQLKAASKLQNTVGNRLVNSNFEYTHYWSTNSTALTASLSNTEKYSGNKSLKLVSNTEDNVAALTEGFYVAPGETCTFSAYVKTESAYAILALQYGAEYTTYMGDHLAANNDWTRLQVSYTNNATATRKITPILFITTAGTAYMDCVQVEKAPTASRFNLVDNGDFVSTGTSQTSWTRETGVASTDTVLSATVAAATLNSNVYSITGSPTATKHITQNVPVSGSKDDTYVLAGWAKGNSAPLKSFDSRAREFAIRAKFNYTDGTTSEYFTAQFNSDSNAWQYSANVMVATQAYSSIQVQIVYDYNVNAAYFDGIQLYKEQFGNSYTYDDEGNVISVQDLQAKTTTYEYDADNNLTEILQDNQAKMTYGYDDYHNVTSAKSDEDITYSFVYDDYGNNTSVSIGTGDTKITSSAKYSDNGNYLESTTDALGKTTTYGYDENTNMLDWVRYPEDTEATRTEYTYDSMYRMAKVEATTDTGLDMSAAYTYEDDLLKSIQTPTTIYNFEYGNFGLRSKVRIGGDRTLATYTYTNQNNYLSSIDYGNNGSVEYDYDPKGRLIEQTYEDGDTVTYTYDNSGARAKVYDSATGITTTNYYDFTDRLMKYVESGSGFNHSVGYEYDDKNNLTKLVETINGTAHTTEYAYDDDNRVTSVTNGDTDIVYGYDEYGRLTQKDVSHDENIQFQSAYVYSSVNGNPTTRISRINYLIGEAETPLSAAYTYHEDGNIKKFTYGPSNATYEYDSAGQLTRENNKLANKTWVWEYDNAGNIKSRKEYAYTTGELGEVQATITYGYCTDEWKDLLTSYNGNTIAYDDIGNPTNDGTWTYTWEHGRQLAQMTGTAATWNYTYNADGMRTSRTNGTDTYTYVYNGSQLTQMTKGSDTLYFTYDANGIPVSVTHDNGTTSATYYYITNLQGDVMHLFDVNGNTAGNYFYDAWGNLVSASATTICQLNPLRYRGYVYDTETELYYLQSRYYNPEVGRFINADNYPSTGQGLTGNNMFAYCGNNPINRIDAEGEVWGLAILTSAVVGGIVSGIADAAIQLATTGTIDWGQTAIATVTGAVSGACALIPGGKVVTTLVSGAINAGLSAGSYALNKLRKGEKIDCGELAINAGVGFISGVAGNLFRYNSTGALRDAGEELLSKGARKLANGVANSSTATLKRAFYYLDRGAELIYSYASRAGVNSGFGSAIGITISAFTS